MSALPPTATIAAIVARSTQSGHSDRSEFVLLCLCVRGMMAETRKIAAILAADIVGFSRMAGADEDRTLAGLRSLRAELIDPTVAGQNGRVFKRTGDGALVEFRSVVEAVRCAVAIQNAMVERNAGPPQESVASRRRRGARHNRLVLERAIVKSPENGGWYVSLRRTAR